FDVEQFVYIKIPEPIQPLDRASLFEDPIDSALAPRSLGHVSGGDSLLGQALPNGTRPIEFSGIDVDTTDREAALELLRMLLPERRGRARTELQHSAASADRPDCSPGVSWTGGFRRAVRGPRCETWSVGALTGRSSRLRAACRP